ncbi:MAG TPA: response regulator [Kofleriaceae bacterium]|nr:response regulator [Kofleriaceae bacterium]
MQEQPGSRLYQLATYAEYRPRILLAEDDAVMRRMVATTLERDGFDVTEVHDGAELLARLEQSWMYPGADREIDLVISDVRMPGLTGLAVLEELRRVDTTTPVLLITAFGDADLHDAAAELGAAVLDKPFELSDLRTAARYYTERPDR